MQKKHLFVLAAVAAVAGTAIVAGTALAAKPPPGQHFTPITPVTWACPPMVIAPIIAYQTDWYVETPQGWLDHAAIQTVQSGMMLQCYYGNNKSNPSSPLVFNMHRTIPANLHNCVLDAPNTSMTCDDYHTTP